MPVRSARVCPARSPVAVCSRPAGAAWPRAVRTRRPPARAGSRSTAARPRPRLRGKEPPDQAQGGLQPRPASASLGQSAAMLRLASHTGLALHTGPCCLTLQAAQAAATTLLPAAACTWAGRAPPARRPRTAGRSCRRAAPPSRRPRTIGSRMTRPASTRLCRKQAAQASTSWRSGGSSQRQTVPQDAWTFGQPKPISRSEPRWPAIQALFST